MDFRPLTEAAFPDVHRTFVEAFGDDAVEMPEGERRVRELFRRRGGSFPLSLGAYDGQRMVAVMATGLGRPDGIPTAYDIFTGVVPTHRGRGLAARLFEEARPALEERGVQAFVLEVLEKNLAAQRVYRRVGFGVTRRFTCWRLPLPLAAAPRSVAGVALRALPSPPGDELADCWSWQPAWQNSLDSLRRSAEPSIHLGAWRGPELSGYGALFPGTGDLAQLAVRPGERRRGIGGLLLRSLAARAQGVRALRIVNVPDTASADLAFLRSIGAQAWIAQLEMRARLL